MMSKLFRIVVLLVFVWSAVPADAQFMKNPGGGVPLGKGHSLVQTDRENPSPRVIGLSSLAATRTSPFEPPKTSDTTFVTDEGAYLDTGCSYRSAGPLIFNIEITRFVGELNPDGTLKNADALISAGLISPTATLVMPAYDIDSGAVMTLPEQPEIDRVSFNGEEIGFLSGENDTWKLNTFEIDIRKVKFAERASNGSTPAGAVNEVRIDIDVGNAPLGEELWCMSIDWGNLSFKAVSPVILIHGNNSNGGFFERQGFTGALAAQKIPFDNSINNPADTIAANGLRLRDEIPAIVRSFGVDSVHLVVHSKGGLDSRDYLANYFASQQSKDFSILSYTSLSTPHNGSVAADVLVKRATAVGMGADIEFQGFPTFTSTVASLMDVDTGTTNLTTDFAASFNSGNISKLPSSIVFNTVAADADQNGNGTLDDSKPNEVAELQAEASGPAPLFALNIVYQVLRNTASVNLSFKTKRTIIGGTKRIAILTSVPTTNPVGNDVLVTIPSGRGEGSIAPLVKNSVTFAGAAGRNHSSVANAGVAATVIPWILDVEKSRGDLK